MLNKGFYEVYKLYLLFCFSVLILDVASMSIGMMENAKVKDEIQVLVLSEMQELYNVKYAMFIVKHSSEILKLTLHPFKYLVLFSEYI